jgi:tetratricopeptide (TPR) repeat protein
MEAMIDNPRIAELRRRVEKDPTSIAFAQLAEEYRRTGACEEAVQVCREGLARHPGYISAQVTLGRALMKLGRFDEASAELEAVLRAAPDNLAAIRALADIHQRRGDAPESIHLNVTPLEEALPVDLFLDATMPTFEETTGGLADAASMTDAGPVTDKGPVTDTAPAIAGNLPSLDALDALSLDLPAMPDLGDWTLGTEFHVDTDGLFGRDQGSGIWDQKPAGQAPLVLDPRSLIPDPFQDPVLDELEEWLAAIVADRSQSR